MFIKKRDYGTHSFANNLLPHVHKRQLFTQLFIQDANHGPFLAVIIFVGELSYVSIVGSGAISNSENLATVSIDEPIIWLTKKEEER